jgi:hypothetical protein
LFAAFARWSCGVVVLADQAAEDLGASYRSFTGRRERRTAVGRSLPQAPMWPVVVVVDEVLGQQPAQLHLVDDEDPVEPSSSRRSALIGPYHERWEIESAYLALRHTLLTGHVLRSGDRPGLEQEIWALLTVYQLLRMAMVDAVETRPGTDPDRASFTTALHAARDCLTAARGVHPTDPTDLPGLIGPAILATLLPARRRRYSTRKVKNATSRYLDRDDGRPAASTRITALEITLHTHRSTPDPDHVGPTVPPANPTHQPAGIAPRRS